MNSTITAILISVIAGYLIGCINLSYLIARLKGFDIREHGSGNAGASNLVIVIGKKIGLLVALLDILKSFFAFRLAEYLFPEAIAGPISWAGVIAGVAAYESHRKKAAANDEAKKYKR